MVYYVIMEDDDDYGPDDELVRVSRPVGVVTDAATAEAFAEQGRYVVPVDNSLLK